MSISKSRKPAPRPSARMWEAHADICSRGRNMVDVADWFCISMSTLRRWLDRVTEWECEHPAMAPAMRRNALKLNTRSS